MTFSADHRTYWKLAAVTMIWGGTFVAGRYLAASVDPLLAASLRFVAASLALLLFMAFARIPLVCPSPAQGVQLAALGFCGIYVYNLCFFYGLQSINASRASLIVALNPAVIGLASWLLFKERFSGAKWLGIALCLGGAATVIVSRNPQLLQGGAYAWRGDLLIFGCVLGWGVYSLFSRGLNHSLGPLQTVTWSILLGTAMVQCDVQWLDGSPVRPSPRQVLRHQIDRLEALGYRAHLATELEFLLFDDTYEQAWDRGYAGLTPASRYNIDYSP